MTRHQMNPPGPIWSALETRDALHPEERQPSEYERRLKLMPIVALLAEYEAQVNAWASGEYESTALVIQARREMARRVGIEVAA